ncbi:MAG TPA: PAS domain-containing protein [Edaphobacter sp.]|uniref:PAS domain-containing sensor histidine kinase n=1 Tax=Edaphobacter sp. TaxID=1934404 RepID=UPI002B8EA8AD|nr:PAS domain-containing protein [Edaphobacter sp.]HUZ96361.1 PAS domain-containing protein [Edaphobacter sp.]
MPRTPSSNTASLAESVQAASFKSPGLNFEALLEISPDAIITFDRDFRITYANPQAARVSQLDIDGCIGRIYWDVQPTARGTILEENLLAAMRSRNARQFEFFCTSVNLWMNVLVTPFADGLAAFYKDISSARLAAQTRNVAAKRLQQTFDAMPDSIVCLDRDWSISFANWRAVDMLASGPLTGENFWQCLHHTLQEPFGSNYRNAMEQRTPTELEAYLPEPVNLWLNIQSIPSDDGIIIFFRNISERRRGEEALRESEARYRLLTELNPQMIWMASDTVGVSYANQRFLDYAGLSLDQATNQDWLAIIHPDDRSTIRAAWQHVHASGKMLDVQLRLKPRYDGEYRWFLCRALPVPDDSAHDIRWLGVCIDIHDYKLTVEALGTSEARYRVLTDLNPQAIWMGDAAGKITYANQGFSDYLGFTTAELDHWITAFHPDDRDRVLDTWADCVSTGAEYDIEARLIRAHDGLPRWWWIRAQPIRDPSGAILYWLGVAIDIDDRKTFAETLLQKQVETERQRAELETIYDTAPVGLALFDPVEFRYLRVNDHQAAIIGLPKDRIIGRSILEIAPIKDLKELFQQVAAGNPVRNHVLEGELPTRPGQHRFWSVNYSPVYGAEGKIEAIAAVVVEITHQKKAENALIQSEKLAAVGRLASSISHEINNPLEAITNLLYLINLSDDLPPSARAYVQTAQSELSRVCQIATQTLRFHRQAVRATNVTAADLVDAVLNLYQGRLANSNIKVETCYSTNTRILCFENDIRQVLNNLIANAIDAMRQGGRLVVRAHDASDRSDASGKGRQGIRITIADTGHGMSQEVRERLFEPFYTTKDLNGTGLGLWISAGIVRRHQGRLSFRSTQHPVHHGTIFSLFLPWAEEPSPPAP